MFPSSNVCIFSLVFTLALVEFYAYLLLFIYFQCSVYSSEKLIALNYIHGVVPSDTHFTAKSTEAMRIKCLAQGHKMQMPGFEPSTSASRNRYSNHMTNMLQLPIIMLKS